MQDFQTVTTPLFLVYECQPSKRDGFFLLMDFIEKKTKTDEKGDKRNGQIS